MATAYARSHRWTAGLLAIVLVAVFMIPAVAQSEIGTTPITRIPGSELQLGGMTVVDEFVYVQDGMDDFLTLSGEPRTGIEPGFDAAGAYFGSGRLTGSFLKYLRKQHGPKSEDTFGAPPAKAKKGDRIVVSIIPMQGPIASDQIADFQLWLGFAGRRGLPSSVGSWTDFFSGNQTVAMGGRFASEDGVRYRSGRTDLGGLRPGEQPDIFAARTRDIGWFDEELNAIVTISWIPKGTDSIEAAVVTSVDDTITLDHLRATNDGARIPLKPAFDTRGQLCYSLKVTGPSPSDDDLLSVEATAVFDPGVSGVAYEQSLIALKVIGPSSSDDDLPSAEAQAVSNPEGFEGRYERAFIDTLLSVFFGAPTVFPPPDPIVEAAGVDSTSWVVGNGGDGGDTLVLKARVDVPAGDYVYDHFPLSARSAGPGIRPGTLTLEKGKTGTLFGDPGCGTWHVPGKACDHVDPVATAGLLGVDPEGVTGQSLFGSDGSMVCVLRAANKQDPFGVWGIETALFDVGAHHEPPFPPTCKKHAEQRDGDGDIAILDCGPGTVTSLQWQGAPPSSRPADRIDGSGPGTQLPAEIRIWLDGLLENGANEDTILSQETHAAVEATAERIAAEVLADRGFSF